MIAEGARKKEIKGGIEEKQRSKNAGTENVPIPTAASHRMARMFHGLNTMSTEQHEDEDEDDDMLGNICYAEFQRYKNVSIALHNIDGSFNDPLAWWKKNATKFPLLATLAREYLAIPATSAPSERIWSRASRVLSLKRASLKAEVAQRIMFVNENLSILHKHYQTLAMKEKGDDRQFMVEYEMNYLPPLESDKDGHKIDVGQSDE
jgi:hypothetical protein